MFEKNLLHIVRYQWTEKMLLIKILRLTKRCIGAEALAQMSDQFEMNLSNESREN